MAEYPIYIEEAVQIYTLYKLQLGKNLVDSYTKAITRD